MRYQLLEAARTDKGHRRTALKVAAVGAGAYGLHRLHKHFNPPHDTFKYTRGLGKFGAVVGGVTGAATGHAIRHSGLSGVEGINAFTGGAHGAVSGAVGLGKFGAVADAIRYMRRKR